jgi:hypothetical protein|nr:MAG TPA: Major tail protein [Caudoviricetes sp.]
MQTIPNTTLYVGVAPWNSDLKNVQSYNSRAEQISTIQGLLTHKYEHINIIRRDTDLILKGVNEDLTQCNYLMYQNADISNKWYFSFIDNVQYNSLNSVIISHTIDVWQTYQFDITYYKNLILRSHVAKSADVVGRWLAAEPISVAPEFERKHNIFNNLSWTPQYVLHSTSVFNNTTKKYEYKGNGTGATLSAEYGIFVNNDDDVQTVVKNYGKLSAAEALKSNDDDEYSNWISDLLTGQTIDKAVKLISTTSISQLQDHRNELIGLYAIPAWVHDGTNKYATNNIKKKDVTVALPTETLACGYTPRNKKMLSSLCKAYLFYNENGFKLPLKPELFISDTPTFTVKSTELSTNSFLLQIDSYADYTAKTNKISYRCENRLGYDANTGLDKVLNTLTSAVGVVNAVGSVASQTFAGNVGGAVQGAVGAVQQSINMIDALGQRGVNTGASGDIMSITEKRAMPVFADVSPTEAQCRYIDDYLDVYGYAINEIGKISSYMKNRSNWNYIQVANCNIKVSAPNDDINKLKQMFENGVTIWHNQFGDYDQNNN